MLTNLEQLQEKQERAKREAAFLLAEKKDLDRRYSDAMRREQEAAAALQSFLSDSALVGVVSYSASKKDSHEGKAGFYSPAHALLACFEMSKSRRWNLWPYKCRFCPHYHVGNMPAAVREMSNALAAA